MNISAIIAGKDLQIGGRKVFDRPVIGNDRAIITCLEGGELAQLAKHHPTAMVTIFVPRQGLPTLQPTLKALSDVQDRCYVRLPSEEYLDRVGDFPHSRVCGALTIGHFNLEVAETLDRAAVPQAGAFLQSAVAAVMNP